MWQDNENDVKQKQECYCFYWLTDNEIFLIGITLEIVPVTPVHFDLKTKVEPNKETVKMLAENVYYEILWGSKRVLHQNKLLF